MGVDVEIYFKLKPSSESWLTERGIWSDCSVIEGSYPNGATHFLMTLARYYGSGYYRGDWPNICRYLMHLITDENIESVWYLSDLMEFDESTEPITSKEILELSEIYMTEKG